MPQDRFVRDRLPGSGPPPAPRPELSSRFVRQPVDAGAGEARWGDYAGMLVRGAGGFVGNAGGLVGAAAGGGSDLIAQILERVGGSRDDFNPWETAASAGTGLIPFGKAASVLGGLAKGAVLGGGSAAATDVAQQIGGESDFDIGRTGRAALTGGTLGVGGGLAAHGLQRALGGRGAASSLRDTLRQEAAEAGPGGASGPRPLPRPALAAGAAPPASLLSVRGMGIEGADPLADLIPSHQPGTVLPKGQKRIPVEPTRGASSGLSSLRDITPPAPRLPEEDLLGLAGAAGPARGGVQTGDAEIDDLLAQLGPQRGAIAARPPSYHELGSPEYAQGASAAGVTYRNTGDAIEAVTPDGLVLGRATYTPNETGLEMGEILVNPNVQRQGIGTGIMDELKAMGLPIDRGPLATPEGAAFRAATGGSQKLFVPAEHVIAHRNILERQAAAPGTGNTTADLVAASKQWQETDPQRLWSLERKATKAARGRAGASERLLPVDPAQTPRNRPTQDQLNPKYPLTKGDNADLTGEAGAASPELLAQLGLHLGGAATGAAAAGATSDDDTRLRNMLGAGVLGGVAPLAVTNPQALQRARYFSLLGSASPQIKNLLGGAGSTVVRAGEEALTGNTGTAKDLLANVFSPETATRFKDAFADAGQAAPHTLEQGRWGTTEGVLGIPSRVMHAADEAVTGGLQRGGLDADEARTTLMTSQPKSDFGRKVTDLAKNPVASTIIPFARTATNMVERGLEHTPGIGMLPGVRGMRNSDLPRTLARQGMGAAALGAGAYFSEDIPDEAKPFIAAGLGPLALPYLFGEGAAQAAGERGDPFSNIARSPADVLRQSVPLPSDAYDYDPGRLAASWIPGVVRDASLDDPRSFSTSRSIFDPTIAKIPGLNRAVLPRKARRSVER